MEVVTFEPAGPGGDTAQLLGEVDGRDGCLTVINDNGHLVLVVMPENKVSYSRSGELKLFGKQYKAGDTIDLGGGGSKFTRYAPEWTVPMACQKLDPLPDLMWMVAPF